MTVDNTNALDGLAQVHQHFVTAQEGYACGAVLCSELRRPDTPWRPTFAHEAYRAADPSTLGLGGTDSFHDLGNETVEAAIFTLVDIEGRCTSASSRNVS